MRVQSKTLRNEPLNVHGALYNVDAEGFVCGLSDDDAAYLTTIPGYVAVPAARPAQVDETVPEPAKDAVRKPGRPRKGE